MRTLIYVPVIHSSADLGSLAKEVTRRGVADFGPEFWAEHEHTILGFWDAVIRYFDSAEVSGFKLYQDGMITDGEVARKIVEEGVKAGSRNYELVAGLLKKGAVLPALSKYVDMTGVRMKNGRAYLEYRINFSD